VPGLPCVVILYDAVSSSPTTRNLARSPEMISPPLLCLSSAPWDCVATNANLGIAQTRDQLILLRNHVICHPCQCLFHLATAGNCVLGGW
jgi:hypothetical protein